MSEKYSGMTNKDFKEYCEEGGIDVDSKNVSKPTRKEYIKSIEKFEGSLAETNESKPEVIERSEPVVDSFAAEVESMNKEVTPVTTGSRTNRKQKKRAQEKEVMSLKRVLITSNSTNQTKTNGIERISWGNRLVGHNTDNVVIGKPWHVREGALRNMRGAVISQSIQDDDANQVRSETVPAWNIQLLDPLTKKEIEKIGKRQIIRDASIESLV